MKIVKMTITTCALLLIASTTFAQQDATTREKLAEIEGKLKDIDSYKVTMSIEMNMLGQEMTTEGEIAFKRPQKVRMKTKTMGMAQETYSTGDVMWTYMPMQRKAMMVNLKRVRSVGKHPNPMGGQANITKPFEGLSKDAIKYIESKDTDQGQVYIFEAKPDFGDQSPPETDRGPMHPEKVIMWILSETGLPTKTIMIGKNGATMMEQTYSDFQINPVIDDSEFEFTPPQGVQVVDMTLPTMHK